MDPNFNAMPVVSGKVRAEDESIRDLGILVTEHGVTQIDTIHANVHKGIMLTVGKTYEVADSASIYIHHTSGAARWLHSQVAAETLGEWLFESFEGTTYSNNGVELPIFNRKSPSPYVPEVKFYDVLIAQIDVLGADRFSRSFGFGDIPSRLTTGSINQRIESDFGPDVDILTKWTNNSGATRKITIGFDCYEDSEG